MTRAALIVHLPPAVLPAVRCNVAASLELQHAFRAGGSSVRETPLACVCKPDSTHPLLLRPGAKALRTLHIPLDQPANNPFCSPRQDSPPGEPQDFQWSEWAHSGCCGVLGHVSPEPLGGFRWSRRVLPVSSKLLRPGKRSLPAWCGYLFRVPECNASSALSPLLGR